MISPEKNNNVLKHFHEFRYTLPPCTTYRSKDTDDIFLEKTISSSILFQTRHIAF